MNNFLLQIVPGLLAKYEYTRDLLKWTGEAIGAIETHRTKSTAGYPQIEPLLLSSLEKAAQDIGSVALLRQIVELHACNQMIAQANANSSNAAARIDTFFYLKDEIPSLEADIKAKFTSYARKTILLFVALVLVFVILACPIIWLAHCR